MFTHFLAPEEKKRVTPTYRSYKTITIIGLVIIMIKSSVLPVCYCDCVSTWHPPPLFPATLQLLSDSQINMVKVVNSVSDALNAMQKENVGLKARVKADLQRAPVRGARLKGCSNGKTRFLFFFYFSPCLVFKLVSSPCVKFIICQPFQRQNESLRILHIFKSLFFLSDLVE